MAKNIFRVGRIQTNPETTDGALESLLEKKVLEIKKSVTRRGGGVVQNVYLEQLIDGSGYRVVVHFLRFS
jgi:hypothetical protein